MQLLILTKKVKIKKEKLKNSAYKFSNPEISSPSRCGQFRRKPMLRQNTSSTRSPRWYYCSPHLPALLVGTLLFTQWVSLLIVRWQILAAPSVSSSASPFSQSSTTCTLGQKFSDQFSLKSLETQSNWLESKRLLGNSWHISTNFTLVY